MISQKPSYDSHVSSDQQRTKISDESAGVSSIVQSQADNDSK